MARKSFNRKRCRDPACYVRGYREPLANTGRATTYGRIYRLQQMNKASLGENGSGERDYSGTPIVAVYVKPPLGIINMECELVDPDDLLNQLRKLKLMNVNGVMVDAWWGIVEANNPQQYNWKGYKQLFQIVREADLKLQVVMSFHECGGDDVHIPLPKWIKQIGQENPDIYFTDRDGRRNPESLTWGIDEQRVLRGRTAIEVYYEYMRSFRDEFDEFFRDRSINKIEIGLGAHGELSYPSCPAKHGWEYPGIGEFQCYDKYLKKCLEKAAEARGDSSWGRPPDNAGSYNSQPQDTKFFCDGGDYDSAYGKFFLHWYSQHLIDHGDRVLAKANSAFKRTGLVFVKLSGMHWRDNTARHAAQLTAGFYKDYAPVISMMENCVAGLNFTCVEPEAMIDPTGFVLRVMNAAWNAGLPVTSENAHSCYDREGYNKILDVAKPRKSPDGEYLAAFTYVMPNQDLFEQHKREFQPFVKRMHGEADDSEEDVEDDSEEDLEEDSEEDLEENSKEDWG